MNVAGLLYSGIYGIANRGWQEVSKSLDRLAVTLHAERRWRRWFAHLAPDPAPEVVAKRLRADAAGRFFAGVDEAQAGFDYARRFARHRDRAIASAQARCDGRFALLGYQALCFGDPIDWHLDPVTRRRAPLRHWSLVDPLDAEAVGDSKVVWELNRHQWLVDLGQAYRLTGDEKYAQTFVDRVGAWMRANPPGIGINWASSLEVALRIVSWSWAIRLFSGSPRVTPAFYAELLAWLRAHALHVERYMSHQYSPNTHLTGEALGLFYAGTVFRDLDGAARWRETGARVLNAELDRQVLPDGVHFEQSTCYHRYTIEIYLHYLILAAANNVAVPPATERKVQAMLDYLLAVAHPKGTLPNVGDADGGWLLPLVHRLSEDPRGLFAVAAAYFVRPDYAWAAGRLQPEVYWLLGGTGCKHFELMEPSPPQRAASKLFEDGGIAVMRDDWTHDAHQLRIDLGPIGCPVSSGHGHADLLAIDCAAFGKPVIVDPGTYRYTADSGWRSHFRCTGAHNTVVVDRKSQAVPDGPFGWDDRPRVRLRQWISDARRDFVDAEHDAYARLPDPVRHRRRVLFVKPRYWVVVDDLYGEAEHEVALHFQFAPELAVTVEGDDGLVRARDSKGRMLYVRPYATVPLDASIMSGSLRPKTGWVAPEYGRLTAAPALDYTATARFPLRIVTLIVPAASGERAPARARFRAVGRSFFFALPGESLVVDDDVVAVNPVH